MAVGTTVGEAVDRGRGGFQNYQGAVVQEADTKSGEISLDLTGNLEVVRPEDITSERGESKRKGSMEGAAQFPE